uniref:Uncharacterized protein n=1 Tax=Malurus cyaneus samueli TaxID=2593467 RepID=A0A8C5T6L6_9PASS
MPLDQSVCGTGWIQDVYWCPGSLCCLILDISKLELESDLTTDVARTSLTKPYWVLGLGVGNAALPSPGAVCAAPAVAHEHPGAAGWYLVPVGQSKVWLTGLTPVTPCCLLRAFQCLWCASSGRCMEYPVRRILPPADLCELRSARWGVCWGECQEESPLCEPCGMLF